MAIVLRLDKAALMHLLEESSNEFKLEITTAVAVEAARMVELKASAIARAYVDKQCASKIAKVVREEFANTDSWDRTTSLKGDFQAGINQQVRNAVDGIVHKAVENIDVDAIVERILVRVEDNIHHKVNKSISALTEKAVLEILGGVPQG